MLRECRGTPAAPARAAIHGYFLGRHELTPRDRDAMFLLLRRHFDGVQRPLFENDLAEKDWVVLLRDERGEIQAFSTLQVGTHTHAGQTLRVVYSGDTIVDAAAWGSFELHKTWIGGVMGLCERPDRGKFYWLLISSGYRTYRFLPLFFREFYPRYDAATPNEMNDLMRRIAKQRFGHRFHSEAGIVRFHQPQVLLPGLGDVTAEKCHNPHIRYFVERNPGHMHGDELVCLAEVCRDNLTAAGRRMWDAASGRCAIQP